jgi:hypothetical protein
MHLGEAVWEGLDLIKIFRTGSIAERLETLINLGVPPKNFFFEIWASHSSGGAGSGFSI